VTVNRRTDQLDAYERRFEQVRSEARAQVKRIGPIQVNDFGNRGCRIDVVTGDDPDEFVAFLLTPGQEQELAAWLANRPAVVVGRARRGRPRGRDVAASQNPHAA
jgi:hypothetical protein